MSSSPSFEEIIKLYYMPLFQKLQIFIIIVKTKVDLIMILTF